MEIDNLLQNDRTLFIIRSEDLRAFAENVAERINRQPVKEEPEPPINQSEAIEFMGRSRQTFYSWRRKGIIEGHPMNGRVYYYKSELQDALSRRG